ncbi:hypothetical protein ACLF3G_10705 [Falsiroseomonas sp. HC035]|uniref:hypothetical protein n=1 Tax=Falsiroseomonas sp. HC035 TaxID=3390999 RepID=UPI003D317FE1
MPSGKRTIPAFATGVIHDLLLGFGLYLGLWLDSCGAARPGAGLGPDDPETA